MMSGRIMSEQEREQLRDFAIEAARLMRDRHCEDVTLVDVSQVSQVCQYVLIASGTSDRQMKSVADELEDLGDEHRNRCFRSSKDSALTWIVVDFIDVVAHLFEPGLRQYYDLEELWADGERVEWRRPEDISDDGAADAEHRNGAEGA
jgi:ribosome-associated protein